MTTSPIVKSISENNLSNKHAYIIEKLRNTNLQNFSAILNAPPEQPSYYNMMTNMLYNSFYDEKSLRDDEITKSFDKFSNSDIELGNNTFESDNLNNNNNNNKNNTLKELLNENFNNYINSISNEVKILYSNHYKTYNKENYISNNIERKE